MCRDRGWSGLCSGGWGRLCGHRGWIRLDHGRRRRLCGPGRRAGWPWSSANLGWGLGHGRRGGRWPCCADLLELRRASKHGGQVGRPTHGTTSGLGGRGCCCCCMTAHLSHGAYIENTHAHTCYDGCAPVIRYYLFQFRARLNRTQQCIAPLQANTRSQYKSSA